LSFTTKKAKYLKKKTLCDLITDIHPSIGHKNLKNLEKPGKTWGQWAC